MAAAEPLHVTTSKRYTTTTSKVVVERRPEYELSAGDIVNGAVRVTQLARQVSNQRKSGPRKSSSGVVIDYADQLGELVEDFDIEAVEGKKDGALRTGVHYALELIAKAKATRAIWFISFFAIEAFALILFLGLLNMFTMGVAHSVDVAATTVQNQAVTTAAMTPLGVGAIAAVNVGDALTDGAVSANIANAAESTAVAAGAAIEDLTGIPVGALFDVLSPITWFETTYYITFAVGAALMLITAVIFFMCGISPLWGRGAEAKYIAFCFGMVGCAIPVLNLVPWFAIYAAVIWFHPR